MALNAEQLDAEIATINEELNPLLVEYNAFINEKKPPIDSLLAAKSHFEKKRQSLN